MQICGTMHGMKLSKFGCAIIAHRGASADAPENTMQAFELAIEQGAEWIEFDVRSSQDGVLFIHHDATQGNVILSQLTFAAIRTLPGAESIPTLVELLRGLKGRVKLDIELKEPGYEAQVVSMATHYFDYEDLLVTSFTDKVLAAVKEADPRVRTGLLVGQSLNSQDPLQQLADLYPVRRVRRIKADLVASHYLFGDVIVRWLLRRAGIPMAMWTIDNPRLIRRYLRDPNVVAIITNRPWLGLKLLAEARVNKRR